MNGRKWYVCGMIVLALLFVCGAHAVRVERVEMDEDGPMRYYDKATMERYREVQNKIKELQAEIHDYQQKLDFVSMFFKFVMYGGFSMVWLFGALLIVAVLAHFIFELVFKFVYKTTRASGKDDDPMPTIHNIHYDIACMLHISEGTRAFVCIVIYLIFGTFTALLATTAMAIYAGYVHAARDCCVRARLCATNIHPQYVDASMFVQPTNSKGWWRVSRNHNQKTTGATALWLWSTPNHVIKPSLLHIMLSSTQRNIELNPIDMHVVELVDIKDFVCKTTQNAILLYDTNTDAALVAHNDGTQDETVEIRFVRGLSGITLVDNDSDVYSHVCKIEFVAGKDAIVTIKSHTPDEVVL